MLGILLETIRDWVQSVLTNFYSMYLGYITPQMFGAVGDGVHDDTQAIKRCLETNGKVFIPKGVYLVTRGQNISLPENLHVEGAGREQSIIRFVFPNSTQSHGFRFDKSNSNSFIVENVSFESVINEDDTTYNEKDTVLLFIKGIINELVFRGCRFTSTGNSNTKPHDTLVWCMTGGKSLLVEDCLFENFTNNQVGGCFWHRSYDDSIKDPSLRTMFTETVVARNCEFRSTNSDEALAFWDKEDNDRCGFRNVIIEGNTFSHKNWNGECHSTSQIVNIASLIPEGVSTIDAKITNNLFYVEKVYNTVIKIIGVTKTVCEGNTMHVASKASDTGAHSFIETRLADATIRDNNFISDVEGSQVQIDNEVSNTLYYNNQFTLASYLRIGISAESYKADSNVKTRGDNFCIFDGNVINIANGSLTLQVNKRDSEKCTLIIKNNTTTATSLFFSAIGTSRLEILNNTFKNDTGNVASSTLVPAADKQMDLKFENNRNIKLNFNSPNEEAKLAKFRYIGEKGGLSIKSASDGSVEDNSSVNIRKYFAQYSIAFLDGYKLPDETPINFNNWEAI